MDALLKTLPSALREIVGSLPPQAQSHMEEIRIRQDRPLQIVTLGREGFACAGGGIGPDPRQAYRPTKEDCAQFLDLLTYHSVYSFEEELKRGFITAPGGHRVGLAGRVLLEEGRVRLIRDVTGFNVRIARQVIGCGRETLEGIADYAGHTVWNTLVVSPPQQGKTTLVRDLARLISSGGWGSPLPSPGRKVGIVDERSELAACVSGVPRFDVGARTDVLDGCPKAEGMMMMIRSMSPDVLVVDEIGRPEDAVAIEEALHAGIRVIATAHGADMDDIRRRPVLRGLCERGVFDRYVVLSRRAGVTGRPLVFDGGGKPMPFTLPGALKERG